jgi:dTDP-4-amino-4,6-dideoxygalactose transaminase
LNTITYTNGKKMIISESIASRVLCLPLYNEMEIGQIKRIIKIINSNI